MTKVKVTREVAEEIRKARIHFTRDAGIIMNLRKHYALTRLSEIFNNREREGGMRVDVLMQALVLGYEAEKTPKEKVREYYDRTQRKTIYHPDEYDRGYENGTAEGVEQTLNLLGIEIEGVNA
ncbi:hypothetical protein [Sporosarcina psychrophila]|uniref:Uncharacterized protein n=1 Tax=Sporosarcina psychrophila TaxID=1476 RepID=A0ABV2KBM3_SPOPS